MSRQINLLTLGMEKSVFFVNKECHEINQTGSYIVFIGAVWEESPTDKNPRSYGPIANKENGSETVIADKTVVLRIFEQKPKDNIAIVNKNWISDTMKRCTSNYIECGVHATGHRPLPGIVLVIIFRLVYNVQP